MSINLYQTITHKKHLAISVIRNKLVKRATYILSSGAINFPHKANLFKRRYIVTNEISTISVRIRQDTIKSVAIPKIDEGFLFCGMEDL